MCVYIRICVLSCPVIVVGCASVHCCVQTDLVMAPACSLYVCIRCVCACACMCVGTCVSVCVCMYVQIVRCIEDPEKQTKEMDSWTSNMRSAL